nr:MAG TPA: hypothetical protein [Bacteriophage sp.]
MTVTVDDVEYDRMKAAYDAAHEKYGDYDDEQIDQLIDLKVRSQVSEWEQRIGAAKLQEQIQLARERAAQANRDAEAASRTYVELRQVILEDSVSAPVIETDEEMEKLIKGE